MSRNNTMGVVGGLLIILASFLVGSGFDFNSSTLDDTTTLVLFIAGLGVVVFLLMSRHNLATYAAVAAATIALIWIIEMFRADAVDLTVKLVVLIVGVVLALLATVGKRH